MCVNNFRYDVCTAKVGNRYIFSESEGDIIMKRKIRVVDNVSNKVVEKEIVIPNKEHLAAQIKYPAQVHRDKTKYSRKTKHKGRNDY